MVVAGFAEGMQMDRRCDDISLVSCEVDGAFAPFAEVLHLSLEECVCVGSEAVTFASVIVQSNEVLHHILHRILRCLDGDTVALCPSNEVAGRFSHGCK